MIYTAFLYAKMTRSNNVSEWKFFEAYRKSVGKLTVQCYGSWVLWVKKNTHTHTTIIVKVCVLI